VEILRPERNTSQSPLFQVMFVLQNAPLPALNLPGLALEPLGSSVVPRASTSPCSCGIPKAAASAARVQHRHLGGQDGAAAGRLVPASASGGRRRPDVPVSRVGLLDEAESQALIVGFNQTAAEYHHTACAHQLLEAHAQANPEAVAVIDGERHLVFRIWKSAPPAWPATCVRSGSAPRWWWGSASSARWSCWWRFSAF